MDRVKHEQPSTQSCLDRMQAASLGVPEGDVRDQFTGFVVQVGELFDKHGVQSEEEFLGMGWSEETLPDLDRYRMLIDKLNEILDTMETVVDDFERSLDVSAYPYREPEFLNKDMIIRFEDGGNEGDEDFREGLVFQNGFALTRPSNGRIEYEQFGGASVVKVIDFDLGFTDLYSSAGKKIITQVEMVLEKEVDGVGVMQVVKEGRFRIFRADGKELGGDGEVVGDQFTKYIPVEEDSLFYLIDAKGKRVGEGFKEEPFREVEGYVLSLMADQGEGTVIYPDGTKKELSFAARDMFVSKGNVSFLTSTEKGSQIVDAEGNDIIRTKGKFEIEEITDVRNVVRHQGSVYFVLHGRLKKGEEELMTSFVVRGDGEVVVNPFDSDGCDHLVLHVKEEQITFSFQGGDSRSFLVGEEGEEYFASNQGESIVRVNFIEDSAYITTTKKNERSETLMTLYDMWGDSLSSYRSNMAAFLPLQTKRGIRIISQVNSFLAVLSDKKKKALVTAEKIIEHKMSDGSYLFVTDNASTFQRTPNVVCDIDGTSFEKTGFKGEIKKSFVIGDLLLLFGADNFNGEYVLRNHRGQDYDLGEGLKDVEKIDESHIAVLVQEEDVIIRRVINLKDLD
jgi:hypothetical protein